MGCWGTDMREEPPESGALVNGAAEGQPLALAEFGNRFAGLALTLVQKLFPEAQGQTARALAQRALQACVDELPLVRGAFAESDQLFPAWVGVVCGRYLHEARAEQELGEAAKRLRELLPRELPSVQHFSLRAYYRPSWFVSGDFYDALLRHDGSLAVLIADVMGHGAPASQLVAAVKTAFHVSAETGGSAHILTRMNRILHGVLPASCFVVGSVLILGPREGQCTFANAGMEGATVLWRNERLVEPLILPGLPLAMLPDSRYGLTQIPLQSGDAIFLCTDGVRDLQNEAGEKFCAARLPELLHQAATSSEDPCAIVSQALERFAPAEAWGDDACFLVATAR